MILPRTPTLSIVLERRAGVETSREARVEPVGTLTSPVGGPTLLWVNHRCTMRISPRQPATFAHKVCGRSRLCPDESSCTFSADAVTGEALATLWQLHTSRDQEGSARHQILNVLQ
jgi:hypothetical protein